MKQPRFTLLICASAMAFLFTSNSVIAQDDEMQAHMAQKANDVLSAQTSKAKRFVKSEDLNEALFSAGNGDRNAYFILDLRSPDDYCAGHIDASNDANIRLPKVGANLDKLPMDQPIVTICGSGQSASYVTAILQMLGYDAYTLQYGMTRWMENDLPLVACD